MPYTRYPGSRLGSGSLAAHERHRLMLLGSPPDMVHRFSLRETGSSTLLSGGRQHADIPADRDSFLLQRFAGDRAPLTPQLVQPYKKPSYLLCR